MLGLSSYFNLFIRYWFLNSNPTTENLLKKENRLTLNNLLREPFRDATVNLGVRMNKFETMRTEMALTDFDSLNKVEIAAKFFEKGHLSAAQAALDVLNSYQGMDIIKKHMKEVLEKE